MRTHTFPIVYGYGSGVIQLTDLTFTNNLEGQRNDLPTGYVVTGRIAWLEGEARDDEQLAADMFAGTIVEFVL